MARTGYEESVKAQLIKIVETYGGEQCRCWTSVARVFEDTTGIKVQNTFDLKKKWEMFTRYTENLTKEELQVLYTTGVKCRGNHKAGNADFFQQTGKKLFRNRYRQYVQTFLVQALKLFVQSYFTSIKIKQRFLGQERFTGRISYTSVHIMLRAVDLKDETDFIVKMLKRSAEKLETLLLVEATNHEEDRLLRFEQYRQYLSRQEFRQIAFFLDYVNDLKSISINLHSEEIISNHPLLLKTNEANKQSKIYQLIILESDWQKKYDLYQQCIAKQDSSEFSLMIKKSAKGERKQNKQNTTSEGSYVLTNYDLIPSASHRICNKASKQAIKQTEKQELKTFRGHYYREGQIRTRGLTTILFDHDMKSDDELHDAEQIELERKEYLTRMQQLYEYTFGKNTNLVELEKNSYFMKN